MGGDVTIPPTLHRPRISVLVVSKFTFAIRAGGTPCQWRTISRCRRATRSSSRERPSSASSTIPPPENGRPRTRTDTAANGPANAIPRPPPPSSPPRCRIQSPRGSTPTARWSRCADHRDRLSSPSAPFSRVELPPEQRAATRTGRPAGTTGRLRSPGSAPRWGWLDCCLRVLTAPPPRWGGGGVDSRSSIPTTTMRPFRVSLRPRGGWTGGPLSPKPRRKVPKKGLARAPGGGTVGPGNVFLLLLRSRRWWRRRRRRLVVVVATTEA